jgi:hypothetical protein
VARRSGGQREGEIRDGIGKLGGQEESEWREVGRRRGNKRGEHSSKLEPR